jgi:acyl-CoA thioesterase I
MPSLHLCRVASCLIVLVCPAFAQPNDSAKVAPSQRQRQLLLDWASLTRYGSEDSEEWVAEGNGEFFSGKPYLNRGIRDQSTGQMLVRFRQDVIELQPKVVVIQAGTNDLGGLTGPVTEGMMMENFMSMTELAKVHGIRVVIASVLPVCDCFTKLTALRPQGKIIALNGSIKSYAAQSGSVYLDYYSALASGRDFKKELTSDGLLPNRAGYAAMAPLVERAIAQALAGK